MHNTKLAVDGTIAAGALTLPWWALELGAWGGLGVTLATLVLVLIRIRLAVRDWRGVKDTTDA
jgi:hypothetical protein